MAGQTSIGARLARRRAGVAAARAARARMTNCMLILGFLVMVLVGLMIVQEDGVMGIENGNMAFLNRPYMPFLAVLKIHFPSSFPSSYLQFPVTTSSSIRLTRDRRSRRGKMNIRICQRRLEYGADRGYGPSAEARVRDGRLLDDVTSTSIEMIDGAVSGDLQSSLA